MTQTHLCIFCSIIRGEAESSKVYEDNDILAFMDVRPVRKGQLLIIPKEHIDHFCDIPDEIGSKIFLLAQKLSLLIREKLKPQRVGLVVHGYGVAHAHLIVIPQEHPDDITTSKMARIENGKIIFSHDQIPLVSGNELNALAESLKMIE